MIQSAGCSDWHSLNSIFVERRIALKETLNFRKFYPFLLPIFAWINLLMVVTYALYDNLVPNVWKVNGKVLSLTRRLK